MTYENLLKTTPTEPALAVNYGELVELWDQFDKMNSSSEIELKVWEERVEKLLRPMERASFMDETNHWEPSNAVAERFDRLTKLLLSRHGIQIG
jgi:hypothetical protein